MNAPLQTLFNGEPANFKNWMFLLESHLSQRGFQVEGLNDAQETQLFHIIVLSTEGAATDVLSELLLCLPTLHSTSRNIALQEAALEMIRKSDHGLH